MCFCFETRLIAQRRGTEELEPPAGAGAEPDVVTGHECHGQGKIVRGLLENLCWKDEKVIFVFADLIDL